jgi:hypothetical protein
MFTVTPLEPTLTVAPRLLAAAVAAAATSCAGLNTAK